MDKNSEKLLKTRKRKSGQRVNLAGGSERFSSSFKRLMVANRQTQDGFKAMGDDSPDINSNYLENSDESSGDMISVKSKSSGSSKSKLLGNIRNKQTVFDSSLQSRQPLYHSKESETPTDSSGRASRARRIKEINAARSSDSDIDQESDKESADYTDNYYDRGEGYDDYNEDGTIESVGHLNIRQQGNLDSFSLKVRRRQTRQQEMIDGQQDGIDEINGNDIRDPNRAHKLKTNDNNLKVGTGRNKTLECDENNSLYDRLTSIFKHYLPSSLSSNTSNQPVKNRTKSSNSHPFNQRIATLSGISIHDGQSSDKQVSEMSNNRYKTFGTGGETFQIASVRKTSIRSKSRDSQRLAYSNRYSKLSHHYSRPNNSTAKQSFFQE